MINMTRARVISATRQALMLVALFAGTAKAQNAVFTGKVNTQFGQPLEGANVFITELGVSVATNAQGAYSIIIPAARVNGQAVQLRARSFGWVPQARPVAITAGAQTIDFTLRQDVNRLEEVVVTGVTAGTEQKNLPFTVNHVDEREMPVPAANPLSQIAGKVPGANIVSTSGRPGSAPTVLLRGPKSINGQNRGQQPLYIVDGVILQGGVNNSFKPIALYAVGFQNDAGIAQQPLGKDIDEQREFQIGTWPVVYDPVGQVVTPGQHVNNSIDATGRVGGTSFFASGNNYWEQGAIRYLNGVKRSSLRVNIDQNVGEALTFGVRSYYARSSADGANAENGNGFFRLTRTPVGVNILERDNQGNLFIRSNPLNQGIQNDNPLYWFQNSREMDKSDHFIGAATGRYTALSWLEFNGDFSYDHTNFTEFLQRDKGFRATSSASSTNPLGFQYQEGDANQSINSSLSGLAHRTFGSLDLRYTARYLYEQQDFNVLDFTGNTLAVGGLATGDNASVLQAISSSAQSIRSIGLMSGIDATFRDRYIFSTLFRRDGSSLFGSANRWANYGRAALAWRISDEPWWMLPALNDLKLRASVGTAGGRPAFSSQYETYTIGTGGTLSKTTLGNKNLRPETTLETEFGMDAELLHRF